MTAMTRISELLALKPSPSGNCGHWDQDLEQRKKVWTAEKTFTEGGGLYNTCSWKVTCSVTEEPGKISHMQPGGWGGCWRTESSSLWGGLWSSPHHHPHFLFRPASLTSTRFLSCPPSACFTGLLAFPRVCLACLGFDTGSCTRKQKHPPQRTRELIP